ncbi:MAG: Eco57I restriction-modification methylase domain-containing protein [Promethearchaeota archaeon]
MDESIKITNVFKSIEKAIAAKDTIKIKKYLKSIDSIEESFLDGYPERKKHGVYYTNQEISEFIINEAILLFLNKKILNIQLTSTNKIYSQDSTTKTKISSLLLKSSIFDPACGSGVFLLTAARAIYNAMRKLDYEISDHELRIQILRNIHGLDINESAIALSRLKLIAWAYEDSDQNLSEMIPILKSNILIGNSISNSLNSKFNIVVGNPPYGNILKKEDKEYLKKENVFYKDIYCTFLLKALDWSDGIIGLLVPKSFLLRQGYIRFRNELFSSAVIMRLYDIGPNLFKRATNEVQIVFYRNKDNENEDLRIFDYPNNEIITYPNQQFDDLKVCFNSKCQMSRKSKKIYVYTFNDTCEYCGHETTLLNRIRIKPSDFIYKLINKIEKTGNLNYLNIKDFPMLIRGEEDKGLKQVKKLLQTDKSGSCAFISAKGDFKYYHIKKIKSFDIEKTDSNLLKGNNFEYYVGPRLLIKHNNIIPEAAYSEDNICFTSSIYSLLHEDFQELKYLCAILNSALIQFYCIYAINNQKDTTINLNQYMIRHLPIIGIKDDVKIKISKDVDQILNEYKKSAGVINNTIIKLSQKIDNLFFKLYSITEKESKIIISILKEQSNYFREIYEDN